MKVFLRFVGFLMLGLFSQNGLWAEEYQAPMERSQWYLTASIFECTMVHEIPIYGTAVFMHEAGEELSFYTRVARNVMQPGKAALVVEASSWRPGINIQDLGYVPVTKGNRPIVVDSKRANSMMQGLLAGKAPTMTRKSLHNEERIRVRLNSINFASVYDGYQDCLASLLPVNFRQVERTRVHFTVDKAVLNKEDKRKLDLVVLYILADSSVTEVYIDGHTDNSGRRIYNRRLSKARAESATAYLESKGVNPDIIQTRYHGERYPVAKNSNKKNKAKNRRTTVRLVRGETLSMPTDESPDGELN